MKEMCNNFICDPDNMNGGNNGSNGNTGSGNNGGSGNTGSAAPEMESCAACVLAKVGPAQAYVPSQPYAQPMAQEQSLVCGTAFSELVIPYCSGWHLYQSAKEA